MQAPVCPATRCSPPTSALSGRDGLAATDADAPEWFEFDGGLTEIGHDGTAFAFDNELPAAPRISGAVRAGKPAGDQRRVPRVHRGWGVPAARAVAIGRLGLASAPATCAAPLYWRRDPAGWRRFTCAAPPHRSGAPVCHVSLFEADAYARWSGARLPTEVGVGGRRGTRAGDGNFVEAGALLPRPSTAAAGTLTQMFGDVWEWTQSDYAPYPGFRPRRRDRRVQRKIHVQPVRVARRLLRYTAFPHPRDLPKFFPAAARWQFSGFRLARDLNRRA